MSGYYYLNEDHTYEPCDMRTCANQIEELWRTRKKHVADDQINGRRVSTVWLGLDHNHFGGKPLLLETMVFESEYIETEIYCERYSTWDEAVEGHERAIQWVLDGCKGED